MKSVAELNTSLDPLRVAIRGMVRRMTVTLTSRLWQLTGFTLLDGKPETFSAEAFTGIGFFARPPASGKPEAIVIMIGADGDAPVITAVRDEKTRQAIAGALKADETAAFNSQVILHMTENGEIHGRAKNGVAVSLALKSDVVAVDNKYANHLHATNGTGPVATVLPNPAYPGSSPDPLIPGLPLAGAGIVGTSVLKGH
jgi:phage gp45-like